MKLKQTDRPSLLKDGEVVTLGLQWRHHSWPHYYRSLELANIGQPLWVGRCRRASRPDHAAVGFEESIFRLHLFVAMEASSSKNLDEAGKSHPTRLRKS